MLKKVFFKLRISRTSWILIFASASMFALGIADNIRGPLFSDLIYNFKLTNTEASTTFAISSTFGFIGNLISDRLLKFISVSQLLKITVAMMALGLSAMALVPTFQLYLLSSAFFGLSMGLLAVAQNLIVAENISVHHQTKALSGLHGLYGFSSLVAPFIASYSPLLMGTWRSGFLIASAISVVVFILSNIFRPDQVIPLAHHTNFHPVDSQKSSWISLGLFGGILGFYVVAEILISSRLALYMRQTFQMDLQGSSLYVTYFFTFMLIGRMLFAIKKFAFTLKKQLNLLLLLSFFCMLLGLFVHPFFLALTGLAMAPFYPLAIAYLSEQTGHQKRAYITFAMGFQNLCLITMHLGVGYLTDQFGLLYAFGVGIISLVLSSVCINFHPQIIRQK